MYFQQVGTSRKLDNFKDIKALKISRNLSVNIGSVIEQESCFIALKTNKTEM